MKLTVSRKIHYDAGPNMTPLVDIVMVILIFLMLTGTFTGLEHFLQSNLPIGGRGAAVKGREIFDPNQLEIRVDSTEHAFWATAGQIRTSDAGDLAQRLHQMRQALNDAGTQTGDIQVIISPSRNAKYKYLIQVYEAALEAKFTKVAFATARPTR